MMEIKPRPNVSPHDAMSYIRISPSSERDTVNVAGNQERVIREYCERRGLKLVKQFSDIDVSGSETDRPGLNEMLKVIDDIKNVIVYDQSRLSRNFEQSLTLMFLFQKHGVRVHTVADDRVLDYDADKTLQLVNMIKAWTADYEREIMLKRQRIGIQRYREKHGRWGPRRKEINWKQFDKLRSANVSNRAIARLFKIGYETLRTRIAERLRDELA